MNLDPGTSDLTADDWRARYHDDTDERPARFCTGPGHLYMADPERYDRTPGDLLVRVACCPACSGGLNHASWREVE